MNDQIKQKLIAELKVELSKFPFAEIGVNLAEKVLNLPEKSAQLLTYNTLMKLVSKDKLDEEFVAAINYLASSKLAILKVHALFIDDNDDEYELSDEEFQDFLTTHTVVHPITGDLLENATDFVYPYYSLSVKQYCN